jgi:hypothetical protein
MAEHHLRMALSKAFPTKLMKIWRSRNFILVSSQEHTLVVLGLGNLLARVIFEYSLCILRVSVGFKKERCVIKARERRKRGFIQKRKRSRVTILRPCHLTYGYW